MQRGLSSLLRQTASGQIAADMLATPEARRASPSPAERAPRGAQRSHRGWGSSGSLAQDNRWAAHLHCSHWACMSRECAYLRNVHVHVQPQQQLLASWRQRANSTGSVSNLALGKPDDWDRLYPMHSWFKLVEGAERWPLRTTQPLSLPFCAARTRASCTAACQLGLALCQHVCFPSAQA